MGDKILLRDNSKDDGTKVTNLSYSSPDIITHSQVADPKRFFTDNYTSDPNEALGTQNDNFIYVRVKNIGDAKSQQVYVNLYANQLSLYLNPQNWEKNRISTIRKNQYSTIDSLAANEIGVTDDYFLFHRPDYKNSCFVAVAGSEPNPDFTWINSWAKYVDWVTKNVNVAARNMVTYKEKQVRQYENYLNLSNPYSMPALFLITVEANAQVPDGTKYGIKSGAFGIQREETCSSTNRKFSVTATLQPGDDDYIDFYGALQDASSAWPAGACLIVRAILVQFGMDVAHDKAVLQSVEKEGIFRNARYILTPEEYKCFDSESPVVKIASASQNALGQEANIPAFGLMIGECGVRYV